MLVYLLLGLLISFCVRIIMVQLSETKLKILIGSVILLFIFQEVIIYKYISEPYPALRMPPFSGNNMNSDGLYQTTSIAIKIQFENKDSLLLTPKEFFYNAPSSHHWSLASKFRPSEKTDGSVPHKRFEILEPVIPGFFISRQRSRYEIQQDPETLQWLRNQVREISDEKPVKVSFHWYNNLYPRKNLLNPHHELTGTTTIVL